MTAIGVFATLCGVYGDSSFRFDRVYIYTAAITNISQARVLVLPASSLVSSESPHNQFSLEDLLLQQMSHINSW